MNKFFLATCITATTMLTGCATIMQSTTQDVGISSMPSNATVTVDGAMLGKTPINAKLTRKDNHVVKIELEGYLPYEQTFTKSVSGWVWGNIVFGGLIGLAVDAISGGLYKLTPEQINATLANQGTSKIIRKDGIYLAVVLRPGDTWEKIDQLDAHSN